SETKLTESPGTAMGVLFMARSNIEESPSDRAGFYQARACKVERRARHSRVAWAFHRTDQFLWREDLDRSGFVRAHRNSDPVLVHPRPEATHRTCAHF